MCTLYINQYWRTNVSWLPTIKITNLPSFSVYCTILRSVLYKNTWCETFVRSQELSRVPEEGTPWGARCSVCITLWGSSSSGRSVLNFPEYVKYDKCSGGGYYPPYTLLLCIPDPVFFLKVGSGSGSTTTGSATLGISVYIYYEFTFGDVDKVEDNEEDQGHPTHQAVHSEHHCCTYVQMKYLMFSETHCRL